MDAVPRLCRLAFVPFSGTQTLMWGKLRLNLPG